MKNIALSIFLVLGLVIVPFSNINAEDSVETETASVESAVESSTVAKSSVADNTVIEEETKSSVNKEEVTSPWASLIWVVLSIFVVVLSGSIKLAAKFGIKKAEKKLGFDIPEAVEEIAEGYLVKGINWTENFAKNKADAPRGKDKMVETIRYAIIKAGENKLVRKKIEEQGEAIVERLLKSDETTEEATPKAN